MGSSQSETLGVRGELGPLSRPEVVLTAAMAAAQPKTSLKSQKTAKERRMYDLGG